MAAWRISGSTGSSGRQRAKAWPRQKRPATPQADGRQRSGWSPLAGDTADVARRIVCCLCILCLAWAVGSVILINRAEPNLERPPAAAGKASLYAALCVITLVMLVVC